MLFRHHITNKKKYFFPLLGGRGGGLNLSGKIPTFYFLFFLNPSLSCKKAALELQMLLGQTSFQELYLKFKHFIFK